MRSISVVVPVYNVERYLPDCIQSILGQTFTDFELILVDDGATDTSGAICDEYAAKDSRIKVIHKQNGGLSDARNTGIQQANAKYILFVDSDDYIEKDTLQQSFSLAEQHQADEVMFGYFADVVNEKGEIRSNRNFGSDKVLTDPRAIAEHVVALKQNFVFDSSWNKLYRLELIKDNKVQMPVGEIFEDTAFNTELIPFVQTLVITSKCYYHYMQRDSKRITNTYNPNKLTFLKKRHISMMKYLNLYFDKDAQCVKLINYIYAKYVFSCMIDLFSDGAQLKRSQRWASIKTYLGDPELKKSLLQIQGFSKLDSIVIWILKKQNITLLYCFAKCLYLLKYKYKFLFFKIKKLMINGV